MKRSRPRRRGKKAPALKIMDGLLRQVVLRRDRICQRCQAESKSGRGGALEVAHLKPKGTYQALRYELKNVLLLCHRCHFYFWHKDPLAATAWLEQARPGLMQHLTYLAQTRSKPDRAAERVMLEQMLR